MAAKSKDLASISTFNKLGKAQTTETTIQNQRKTSITQHQRTDASDKTNTSIPRNVNYYRHLIEDHCATEDGIEWVLKLRSPRAETDITQKLETTTPNAPSFYGKNLESQQDMRTTIDLETKGGLHQVHHLIANRIGPTPTRGQVNFEVGLRSYTSTEKIKTMEKKMVKCSKKR